MTLPGAEIVWVHQEANPPATSLRDARVILILAFVGPVLLRDDRDTLDVIRKVSAARTDLSAVEDRLRATVLEQRWNADDADAASEFAVLAESIAPRSTTMALGRTLDYALAPSEKPNKFHAHYLPGMEASTVESIADAWFNLVSSPGAHPLERPPFEELRRLYPMRGAP